VSTKNRRHEHHAVTVRTRPAVYVLIHSDVYVLKFSDREHRRCSASSRYHRMSG